MQGSKPDNRKIRNATPSEYDGIAFKSKLEKMTYQTLKEKGFPVQYEPQKFVIWEGFKPNVPFYNKDSRTRLLKLESKKVISITYSPDFLFYHNGYMVVIEDKGMENDCFPMKKKMFRKWLEENHPKSIYFEIYTKRQLLQAIDIINELE